MPEPALSFFARLWLAIICLFKVVFDPPFAALVAHARDQKALPAPAPTEPVRAPPDAALHLLAQLQREGRFIDFCEEEIASFADADVGAAARTVHAGCRKVLRSVLTLQPVRSDAEGSEVTVAEGFDPASLRLTGNVVGSPPFHGTLRHHGWKAASVKLSPPGAGQDATVLAPAEVELP
ncbi:MAG: DUF2760 domain-containing protein [Myxococcales bacterium]